MSVRSAKISVAMLLLLCSACAIETRGTRTGVDSRTYQCQELKQTVAEQEQVYLRGHFGTGSVVYASSDSCHSLTETPIASAWSTKDAFSCVVGFRCLDNNTLERDF